MTPIFSIIMPLFNSVHTIRQAIDSVLDQTFSNFELIVIDDCSTDGSAEAVSEYFHDTRVVMLSNLCNSGVAETRNAGIKAAIGRYITFLDSDDIWLPKKLELQYQLFNFGADVVYGPYIRFSNDSLDNKLVRCPSSTSFDSLLSGNIIGNLTGAYDVKKVGKHYQKKIGHEDYLMWLNILKVSHCARSVSEPIAKYRLSSGSVSSNKLKAALWMWHIYRYELGLNVVRSSIYFSKYAFKAFLKNI
jgi:glycosyltransferase involved in cell wall biosynthesis